MVDFRHLAGFKSKALSILAIVILLFSTANHAMAQTPTPEPPAIQLPAGWGPTDGINIISATGNTELRVDTEQIICNQGVNMWRTHYLDPTGFIIPVDPPATMSIRLLKDYGDGDPGSWMLRLRFAYWANQYLIGYGHITTGFTIDVLDQNQTSVINTREAVYCAGYLVGTPQGEELGCDPAIPGAPEWRYFEDTLLVRDYAVLLFNVTDSHFENPLDPHYNGFIISSLYADRYDNQFPDGLCGVPVMTPTPQPTWTPWPTWTATPTGTLSATPTLPPTAVGPTATPSQTPIPYATWTPSPSPTPWQSPMATLSSWQITPDATVTFIPTPTTLGALPTWDSWPTVAFPTRVTRTPFPTLIWESLTTTPAPTATPYTLTVDTDGMFNNFGSLSASINYTQVYSAGYLITGSIGGPVRVLRGTVRQYLPSMAGLIDAILIMLFIIVAVYAIKFVLAIGGAIIKLVEVILEFIPL